METQATSEAVSNMDLLTTLELQIEALMQDRAKLSQENDFLRDKLTRATQERGRLHDVTEKVGIRIKKLISQLKDDLE